MGYGATRSLERVAAAMGALEAAPIVFEVARDIPQGGVLLALPALLAVGLLRHGGPLYALPQGFYGRSSVLELLALMALARMGSFEQLRYAADKAEIEPFWGRHQHEKISRDYPHKVVVADYDEFSVPPWVRKPTEAAGTASLKFCTDAIDAAQRGIIDAVVTAPINKTSWKLAGSHWPGHTEMLAKLCKSPRKAAAYRSPSTARTPNGWGL
jgi:hypothetical protein